MASSKQKLLLWQVLYTTVGLATVYFLFKRKNRVSKRKFIIVEADETSGALETGSPPPGSWNSLGLEQPLVIAMVGLPARGKSYIVKMIMRYLRWTGFETKLYNVGSFRRQMGHASADSNFFSASNSDGAAMREKLAMAVQETMYAWLHEPGMDSKSKKRVAIFDATNTTISRRLALAQRARKENVYLLFVESICDDKNVLAQNYEV
jgi:predicted kinase